MGEILLQNGRLIDPENGRDEKNASLLIRDGAIIPVSEVAAADCLTIDLAGKWIVPGLIDMHTHLRDPGQEYKEDILSGTKAAAAGGFTAVACMPNTTPVHDNASVTRYIMEKAQKASARVLPIGAISKGCKGDNLAEFGEMYTAGAVALSDDGLPVVNSQLMRRALEYSASFNMPILSHPEELTLSSNGCMNEGELSTRMGLKGIPNAAEAIMVYREIALSELTGVPIHIAHVSTEQSLALIRKAKEQNIPVTAETAPHYFTLTEEAVRGYNTNAKMNPPLRSEHDRKAVCEALRDGTIDVIATDHAPHTILEKEVEFAAAANGIIGLETAVPLTLELVRAGIISADKMIALLSTNPAKILGVPGGSLEVGQRADVTVIDPDKVFIYTEDMIISKAANSPFIGRKMQGKAVLTIMKGTITFRDI